MRNYQNHPPIFLVGPRCSGKTTLAGLLSRRFDLTCLDTDVLIREEAGFGVPDIVAREGWAGFRQRESRALAKAARPGAVIATGGGMVLAPENRSFMRSSGLVIYLAAPAPALGRRLCYDGGASSRPSLTGMDPAEEMAAVLAEREPLYRECAHHVVDASLLPEQVLEAVSRLLCEADDARENKE